MYNCISTFILEKESKAREGLRMTGVGNWSLILSWYLTYGMLYFVMSLAMAFVSVLGPSFALSTLRYPFVWGKGVLNGYSSKCVSLWDSLMFGRLAMGFANVRAGTQKTPRSESHSEISTRVPFLYCGACGLHQHQH